MLHPSKKSPVLCSAFSMVELSVVIAIMSIVAVMGLESMAGFMQRTAYQTTQDKLAAIDQALIKYRYTYGFLPCPADPTLAITNSNYGKEKARNADGTCSNTDTIGSTIVLGDIPVRDLGLPLSHMKDGYNSRMRYVMTKGLAVASTFASTAEAIKVRTGKLETTCSADCTEYAKRAAYLILSFGADRRGSPAAACGGGDNQYMIDTANCRMGSAVTLSPSVAADVFYVNNRVNTGVVPANHYDDLVRWKAKSDL